MTASAPWWSSDDERLDPDQDPLAAHLAARGLTGTDDPGEDEAGSGDRDGDREDDAAGAHNPHQPGICGVCPICRGHAVLQERHPEIAGHLADAARSLSLALARFAEVVDTGAAGDAGAAPEPGDAARPDAFRPIMLDDDEGDVR